MKGVALVLACSHWRSLAPTFLLRPVPPRPRYECQRKGWPRCRKPAGAHVSDGSAGLCEAGDTVRGLLLVLTV